MNRSAGVLLSITSLPSKYGIGCFSKSAYDFVDWLREAGQSCWQILPLGPTSYGDSPYQSFSTFAGNPYFISLEALVEEGVLTEEECEAVDFGKEPGTIDYEKLYKGRYPLLRKAYERSNISENPEYQKFMAENSWWLADYALFMAVKDRFGGVPWTEWAEDIRLRWGNAMDYYRRELYFDIEFQQYMQFKFYEQWMKLNLMQTQREFRSSETFRFMLPWTVRMHGRIRSCSSWIRTMYHWQWQDARRMDSQQLVSYGGIRCIAGIITEIPDISGGFPE